MRILATAKACQVTSLYPRLPCTCEGGASSIVDTCSRNTKSKAENKLDLKEGSKRGLPDPFSKSVDLNCSIPESVTKYLSARGVKFRFGALFRTFFCNVLRSASMRASPENDVSSSNYALQQQLDASATLDQRPVKRLQQKLLCGWGNPLFSCQKHHLLRSPPKIKSHHPFGDWRSETTGNHRLGKQRRRAFCLSDETGSCDDDPRIF